MLNGTFDCIQLSILIIFITRTDDNVVFPIKNFLAN